MRPRLAVLLTLLALLLSLAWIGQRPPVLPPPFQTGDLRVEIISAATDPRTGDLYVLLRAMRDGAEIVRPDQPFIFRHQRGQTLRDLVSEALRVSVGQLTDDDPVLTVFPDPTRPGTTSVDGDIGTNANLIYATAHSTADCTDCSTSAIISTENSIGSTDGGITFTYSVIRTLMNFDTSALGAGSTISSATCSVKPTATHLDYLTGSTVTLVSNTIVSNIQYATTDFGLISATAQSNVSATISLMTTDVYVDYPLNTTGLANVSKTGITKFGLRTSDDISNSAPTAGTDPSFPNSGGSVVFWNASEAAGTGSDPKLVVTYTSPGGGKKRMFNIGD